MTLHFAQIAFTEDLTFIGFFLGAWSGVGLQAEPPNFPI
jgi:hypothetical protein